MNKYHLLLPVVIAALSGCHSELHYKEQAVESARKYICKEARELTPEEYAFVKLTPPVIFKGDILYGNKLSETISGGGRVQICVTWRIPEKKNDYMVFGVSDAGMNNWSPARLIRRPIRGIDENAMSALGAARHYTMASLYEQLSVEELNNVRFRRPELILSAFDLGVQKIEQPKTNGENAAAPAASATAAAPAAASQNAGQNRDNKAETKEEEPVIPRPWKKHDIPVAGEDGNVQMSLIWQLGADRYAVFCGVGQPDLEEWQIALAGVFNAEEVKKARLQTVKTPEQYPFLLEQTEVKKEEAKEQSAAQKAASAEGTAKSVAPQEVKKTAEGVK